MNWKNFKIDLRKILLAGILISITSSIPNLFVSGADIGINYGYPFNFYGYGGGPALIIGQAAPSYLSYLSIIEDVIFWYLISFFIVWVFDKIGKK